MNDLLLTLGALTLGGSAAVLLLALASRTPRARYGAKWRCWAWLLLCLRLALPFPLLPHGENRAPIQVDVPTPPVAVQPSAGPAASASAASSASSAGASGGAAGGGAPESGSGWTVTSSSASGKR